MRTPGGFAVAVVVLLGCQLAALGLAVLAGAPRFGRRAARAAGVARGLALTAAVVLAVLAVTGAGWKAATFPTIPGAAEHTAPGLPVRVAADDFTAGLLFTLTTLACCAGLMAGGQAPGRGGQPATAGLLAMALAVMAAAGSPLLLYAGWVGSGLVVVHALATTPDSGAAARARRALVQFVAGDVLLLVVLLSLGWERAAGGFGEMAMVAATLPRPTLLVTAGALVLAAASRAAVPPFHAVARVTAHLPVSTAGLVQVGFASTGVLLLLRMQPLLVTDSNGGPALLAATLAGLGATAAALAALTCRRADRQLALAGSAHLALAFGAAGAGYAGAAAFHLLVQMLARTTLVVAFGSGVAVSGRSARGAAALACLTLAGLPFTGAAFSLQAVVAPPMAHALAGGAAWWPAAVLALSGAALAAAALLRLACVQLLPVPPGSTGTYLVRLGLGSSASREDDRHAPARRALQVALWLPVALAVLCGGLGLGRAGLVEARLDRALAAPSIPGGTPNVLAARADRAGSAPAGTPAAGAARSPAAERLGLAATFAEAMQLLAVAVAALLVWRAWLTKPRFALLPAGRRWARRLLACQARAWRVDRGLAAAAGGIGWRVAHVLVWFDQHVVEWVGGLWARTTGGLSVLAARTEHHGIAAAWGWIGAAVAAVATRLQHLHTGRLRESLILSTLSVILVVIVWVVAVSRGNAP